jgi:hypothetical protein
VGLSVYPPIVAWQRLCKDIPATTKVVEASFSIRSASHQRKIGD